jgi:CubicO group peptidase (beta-lactamase class C family)
MKTFSFMSVVLLLLLGCSTEENEVQSQTILDKPMYFPPNSGTTWESTPSTSLGWNQNAVQPLKDYLAMKNTKSFMILVKGRIIMEEYFNGHTPTTDWEWNSAGKTLVATTTGIAQQEGLLNINNKVSDYLGTGWTSEPLNKENLIQCRNLLTMTSGINSSSQLIIPANLTYMADAGTRWSYHNVFQKLMDVVAATSNQNFETYFNAKLKNKIGMDGYWNNGIVYTVYHSTTRSMARFGLLALNKGKWDTEQIINENYFNESNSTSQNMNPSYGYLWWLNGKSSYLVPGSQTVYNGFLVPNAPADMYAALGASDQKIYVIPSRKMVIVRMGDASDPANPSFALSGFDNELWGKINAMIN